MFVCRDVCDIDKFRRCNWLLVVWNEAAEGLTSRYNSLYWRTYRCWWMADCWI